jgi:signal transduction histidine kinase
MTVDWQVPMSSRSWPILTFGFLSLIVLIAVFGYGAMHRARILHRESIETHQNHLQTEAYIHKVSAQEYLAALLVRDYLLDPSQSAAPLYRQQLREIRKSFEQNLGALQQRMGTEDHAALERLASEVKAYWESLDPMFEWNPQQKAAQGTAFLRHEVLPRRQAVVALAERLARLNAANLKREQQRLESAQEQFQQFLRNVLVLCLLLGTVVAGASTYRFWSQERDAKIHHKEIEETGQKLKRLSRGLVNAQEAERKSISRELHDAVGPLVTGVRLELANLESSRTSPEKFLDHLEEARQLNAQTLELIQNMAMGLRPSMLDDIGLGPALEWQGRELSRRTGVPVNVQIDGSLDQLPEAHRTCIFRVVQEALTNCARHAAAKNIRVSLYGREDFVEATVQDDGVGFDTQDPERRGLGLLGMEERARELDGTVALVSHPGKGTILTVELPIPNRVTA